MRGRPRSQPKKAQPAKRGRSKTTDESHDVVPLDDSQSNVGVTISTRRGSKTPRVTVSTPNVTVSTTNLSPRTSRGRKPKMTTTTTISGTQTPQVTISTTNLSGSRSRKVSISTSPSPTPRRGRGRPRKTDASPMTPLVSSTPMIPSSYKLSRKMSATPQTPAGRAQKRKSSVKISPIRRRSRSVIYDSDDSDASPPPSKKNQTPASRSQNRKYIRYPSPMHLESDESDSSPPPLMKKGASKAQTSKRPTRSQRFKKAPAKSTHKMTLRSHKC